MEKQLLSLLFLFVPFLLFAQSSYQEAIGQGDAAFKKRAYQKALDKYFAAEAFDPTKKETVKKKVNLVFDKMMGLQKKAEEEQAKAEKALQKVILEKEKNKTIINAFFFYKNRYALAYNKYNRYGFINKEGEALIDYDYHFALPFDQFTGYAKVKKSAYEEVYHWIDTTAQSYLLADDISFLNTNTEAVQLKNQNLSEIPQALLDATNLKLLFLDNNSLTQLPASIQQCKALEKLSLSSNQLKEITKEIGQLKALRHLDLSNNNLSSLPNDLWELENLAYLNLSNNAFSNLPEEMARLKHLAQKLPNCAIYW